MRVKEPAKHIHSDYERRAEEISEPRRLPMAPGPKATCRESCREGPSRRRLQPRHDARFDRRVRHESSSHLQSKNYTRDEYPDGSSDTNGKSWT